MAYKNTILIKSTAILIMLAPLSTGVLAHGDKKHETKDAVVIKEQKPWGIAGDPKAVDRTIEVNMSDSMRFSPGQLKVSLGETVRFRLHNQGDMLHEFVIGTAQELDKHAALMLKFPNMEHSEPYMAHVPAGKTGEIIWSFNQPGDFDFACLIAGHYQAGMKGSVTVPNTSKTAKNSTKPVSAKMGNMIAEADASMPGNDSNHMSKGHMTEGGNALTEGEVRKINKETGKITLKHGEIKHMDMPPMTMVFQVKDAAALETLKVGDKVGFDVSNENGKMVVTEIEKR